MKSMETNKMIVQPVNRIDANRYFLDGPHQRFPVCTQVTLNHGFCDSRCISCPIGQMKYGDASDAVNAEFHHKRRRHMPIEIFKRVADEVAKHPHAWLRLHARGEPLLHPKFVEMVKYAKQAGVKLVQSFTNAITLNAEKATGVLKAGLDVLECSIHGHTKTYEQLMRNGQFEQVRKNVIQFRKLRDTQGAKTRLVVSAVDQPLFQSEKEAHNKFWSQYADEVIYRPYHSWGDRITLECGAIPESRHACSQLWNRCTIGPSGKILVCFNSWTERDNETLGDLGKPDTTIATVWQSALFNRIRQDHINGDYSLTCCRKCKDWVGSAWGDNSYEKLLYIKLNLTDKSV